MDSRAVRRLLVPHLAIGLIATPWGYAAAAVLGFHRSWCTVAGIFVGAGISLYMTYGVKLGVRATEATIETALPINRRDATPPVGFSHAQSAAARDDRAEATRLFAELVAAHGYHDADLCHAAVDFHTRKGDARAAEAILRGMRRDQPERYELYATQRLIDLYLGRLGDRGRAVSELRRLADRNPGTQVADGALRAITELREQVTRETTASESASPR